MKTYRLKYVNQTLKHYCENLRNEAALIQREIEKQEMKRTMLQDFAHRLENDFIECAEVDEPFEVKGM